MIRVGNIMHDSNVTMRVATIGTVELRSLHSGNAVLLFASSQMAFADETGLVGGAVAGAVVGGPVGAVVGGVVGNSMTNHRYYPRSYAYHPYHHYHHHYGY